MTTNEVVFLLQWWMRVRAQGVYEQRIDKIFKQGGGHWGILETAKPKKKSSKTEKPQKNSAKTENRIQSRQKPIQC